MPQNHSSRSTTLAENSPRPKGPKEETFLPGRRNALPFRPGRTVRGRSGVLRSPVGPQRDSY